MPLKSTLRRIPLSIQRELLPTSQRFRRDSDLQVYWHLKMIPLYVPLWRIMLSAPSQTLMRMGEWVGVWECPLKLIWNNAGWR